MIRQAYYFGAVIAASAFQFFANYLLSQKLLIQDYGRFNLLASGVGVFTSLFMFGQATAITFVYFSEEKKSCKNVRSEVLTSLKVMSFSVFIFGVLGLIIWRNFYVDQLQLSIALLGLLATTACTFQLFFTSLNNCMDRYKDYFYSTLIGGITLSIVVVGNPTVSGYLIALSASATMATMVLMGSLRTLKANGINPTLKIYGKNDLISLGWIAVPGMLISSGMAFSDKYLLSQLANLSDVATYSVAVLISVGVGRVFISALLKSNAISLMQALQTKEHSKCVDIIVKIERLLCTLCLIAVIAYYAVAKKIVLAVWGDRFVDSAAFLLALFIAVMIEGMAQILNQILIQKKKLHFVVSNGAVVLLLSLALNYFMIPSLRIKGAVLTFFLCALLMLLAVYVQAKIYAKWVRFPFRVVAASCLIFAINFFIPAN